MSHVKHCDKKIYVNIFLRSYISGHISSHISNIQLLRISDGCLEFEMENLLYVSICSFSSFSLFLSLTRHSFFRQSESFGYFHRFITISSYYKKICNRKIDELLISRKPVRRHLERLIRQFLFFSFFFPFLFYFSFSFIRITFTSSNFSINFLPI